MAAVPTGALALLFELAVVAVAVWGLLRVSGLKALSDDPRLRRLSWFFGLFAAAIAVEVLVTLVLLGRAKPSFPLLRAARLTFLYHGFMIAAMVVALRAFAPPWSANKEAAAGTALAVLALGRISNVLGLVEALLALYLAIASVVNQRHRRTRGSLRVAAGFLLFFLSHLAFWVFQRTGAIRPFWAEALALGSILLLALSVPRLSRRPA